MKTYKPISTISYNTEFFLRSQLDELVRRGDISFYCYIFHQKEEDELKDHFHLFMIPDKSIDTKDYKDFFAEVIDISQPPLNCLWWQSSKFVDWYLYSLHDVTYLATKGETRKYHYNQTALVSSSIEYLTHLIHTSDFSAIKGLSAFFELCRSGMSFRDLFAQGFVPIQQIRQYERAYYLLCGKYVEVQTDDANHTYRAGRQPHNYIDTDSGEIKKTDR